MVNTPKAKATGVEEADKYVTTIMLYTGVKDESKQLVALKVGSPYTGKDVQALLAKGYIKQV
jgi:hypothetical protein